MNTLAFAAVFALMFALLHVFNALSLLACGHVLERCDSRWPALLFLPGAAMFFTSTLPMLEELLGAERLDRYARALAKLPRKVS